MGVQRLLGVGSLFICVVYRTCSKQEISRDNAHGRILQTELPDNQTLTVQSCIASCSSQNFTLAGLEFGVQCCMFGHQRRSVDRPLVKKSLITLYSLW